MSDINESPLRIIPQGSSSVTAKAARKQIDSFLAEYKERSTRPGGPGGDAAVMAQLAKLSQSLKEDAR